MVHSEPVCVRLVRADGRKSALLAVKGGGNASTVALLVLPLSGADVDR